MLKRIIFYVGVLVVVGLMAVVGGNPAAWADTRSDCRQGDKNPDLSIRACTALIERNPRDIDALWARGGAYEAKDDYDRAIADYTKVLEIDATYTQARIHRGMALRGKGDHDRAIADYTRGNRAHPEG